ncbi:MAG: tetratricopeptide repeat protein [Magnetococcales bacterium]|nr:tetratricopeptide repeat protein [Magnetococcales bacterium]
MNKTLPSDTQQSKLTINEAINLAVEYFNGGNFNECEKLCGAILHEAPNHVDAINLLGVIAQRVNRHDLALEQFSRAIKIDNSNALLYLNLGISQNSLGQHNEAIESYQKAISLKADDAQFHYNMGLALLKVGDLAKGALSFTKALSINPDYVESLCDLGYTQHLLGDSDEGMANLQRAITLQPNFINAHYNLGVVLQDQGEFDKAVERYKKSITIVPDFFNPHYNIGVIKQAQGKIDEAIIYFKNSINIQPDYPQAHYNLGVVLQEKRLIDDAIQSYKKAISIKPDYAQAHSNLGTALQEIGCYEEGVESFKIAIAIQPDLVEAHYNFAYTMQEHGKFDDAIASYKRALTIEPDYVAAHNNLICCIDFVADVTVDDFKVERENWARQHADKLRTYWSPFKNSPEPGRKLRLGYVGADFLHHSAARIFGPMLMNYDSDNFQVFCYAGNAKEDELTAKFKASATGWLSTHRIGDARLAEIIKDDGIDILVDLAGHTKGNRLLTFARKPAPVQISAWGYPLGTGMSAMDYLFGDSFFIPLADRHMYKEKVIDIPCAIHLHQGSLFPPVTELPASESGYITFGAFNRIEKYNKEVYTVWAEILNRIPNAKLLIKTAKLDNKKRVVEIEEFFHNKGVAKNRLILLGRTSHHEHLNAHKRIDIMLDPFPHNSGMTSLESLRMGVPVLTCEKKIRCPASSALLHIMGLDEWNTQSINEYVAKAVKFAGDIDYLKTLRGQLRSRFDNSVLGDSQLYVKKVETIYRQLWVEWCESVNE